MTRARFTPPTLAKFEDASASIPLRRLVGAFEDANIRAGADPGGDDGARRVQFRRYVAGVDQANPRQLVRLGAALGALIDEVAESKVDFLVKAAEQDGFVFADAVFRPAPPTAAAGASVPRTARVTSIDERAQQLRRLANDNPSEAIVAAKGLIASVCRTVLDALGKPAPKKTASLTALVAATLDELEHAPTGNETPKRR
jgi:hypothetical protein